MRVYLVIPCPLYDSSVFMVIIRSPGGRTFSFENVTVVVTSYYNATLPCLICRIFPLWSVVTFAPCADYYTESLSVPDRPNFLFLVDWCYSSSNFRNTSRFLTSTLNSASFFERGSSSFSFSKRGCCQLISWTWDW